MGLACFSLSARLPATGPILEAAAYFACVVIFSSTGCLWTGNRLAGNQASGTPNPHHIVEHWTTKYKTYKILKLPCYDHDQRPNLYNVNKLSSHAHTSDVVGVADRYAHANF